MKLKIFKLNGLFFILLGSLISCLESPILKHKTEEDDQTQTLQNTVETQCIIYFSKENLCASLTWDKKQRDDESGEFTLRFWKKGEGSEFGPYVDPGHTLLVTLWMPSMGHGSTPVLVKAVLDPSGKIIPGVIKVENVFFIMPGEWEIIFQLKNGDQLVDSFNYEIKI